LLIEVSFKRKAFVSFLVGSIAFKLTILLLVKVYFYLVHEHAHK